MQFFGEKIDEGSDLALQVTARRVKGESVAGRKAIILELPDKSAAFDERMRKELWKCTDAKPCDKHVAQDDDAVCAQPRRDDLPTI